MSEALAHANPETVGARWAFVQTSRLGARRPVRSLGLDRDAPLEQPGGVSTVPRHGRAQSRRYPRPVAQGITVVVVLLPLFIHVAWGIGRLFSSRPNNVRCGYFGSLKYAAPAAQRARGSLAFLGAHLWLAFLRPAAPRRRPRRDLRRSLARDALSRARRLVVYVLGVLGVAYHLANGLSGVAMGWGLRLEQRCAARKFDIFGIVVFARLLGLGWGAIYALYVAGN